MKTTLALLSGVFFAAQAVAPDISSLGPLADYPVAWGKPVNGLRVGIWCNKTKADVGPLPDETYFHLENVGTTNIQFVILSATQCVLSLNGKLYAEENYGGMSGVTPPGKHYGPMSVHGERKHEISALKRFGFIDTKAPSPHLQLGSNTISVFYLLGTNFIESGKFQIIAN